MFHLSISTPRQSVQFVKNYSLLNRNSARRDRPTALFASPDFARMSSWEKLRASRNAGKDSITYTDEPVALQLVVSASGSHPWGVGFANGLVNLETKKQLKSCKSPADGFTYMFNWYQIKLLWAHIKLDGDTGYCTLEDFLESEDLRQLWDNQSLVSRWTFHRDTLGGSEISEAEAIELANLFPRASPDAQTPEPGSKRRSFPPDTGGSASGGPSSQRAKRRCLIPAKPHDMVVDHGVSSQIQCAVVPETDFFALVCNTASWSKLPPRRLRNSWIVQYRIADFREALPDYADHPDVQCLLACDDLFGWNPRRHRDQPHKRRIYMPHKHQFWVSCITCDYAVAFAGMLYNKGLVNLLL